MGASSPFLTYWYYHLPNFVLAALMYTLLGRVLLSLFVEPDSSNYIWRFFCRVTDPFVDVVALVTPKAAAPVVRVAVRRRVAVLAARAAAVCASRCSGCYPARELSCAMDRNLYYIGIAFFGMINGIFNPLTGCSPMSSARF